MLKTRLTLPAGASGTKKLVERYGSRLVCVRYRYDAEQRKRLKTVELIEEEAPWIPSAAVYLVKISFAETALREEVKAAGGLWHAQRKLWIVRGATVLRLGLESRIVTWLEIEPWQ